ncbi:MAG: hypothetical protein GC158_02280 [Cyanobacteria bacterium RI_101]|nr:hypothetical protein [Cyanobacteria bacterium RI_101]
MAGLIALFLLGLGCVFLLQNREPVLLYFLGNSSQTALFQLALPLGAWVVLFVFVGLVLGLILPACYRLGQPSRPGAVKPSRPAFGYAREEAPAPARSPQPARESPQTPGPAETWDWNPIPEVEDWQEPEPTAAPSPPAEPKPLEREQAPPQSRQEGSVYRYQYRDKETQSSPEGVYTAPYRVITSPQNPSPAPESAEEEDGTDWV